ncbi:MAG TPA: ABC transporter permease, partial [Gemmatimonadaceae bacterium]|nr:ABC transporter permease [Gemmatimonadaceae bacterium]
MSTRAGIVSRLRSFFRPADAEARMEEEFGFHIEMETRRLVAEGISAAEARRRARVSFGGADAHREAMRDGRGTQWIEDAAADLRYALRSMRRSPGLAIAVALTFGVGVGVNGIVFSFVNSILLRPLPAGQTEELVAMYSHDVSDGDADPIGYDDFLDYRRRSGAFADLAAFNGVPLNLVAGASGSGDMVWGDIVSENFFSVLRMRPAVGRFFTEADGPAGANPLVVLSHRAWRIRFRGDSNVVGQRIRLNGTEFTVVGVAPEGFHGLRTFGFWSDMWVPLGMHRVIVPGSRLEGRGSGWLLTVGRIRPGTSIEATRRSAMLFAKQLQAGYPESNANIEVLVVPAGRGFDNPTSVKPAVLLLVSATGIIAASLMLLLICANLANVQLARAAARGREIAVRLSLGCSRPRLTRQLVVESVTLALPGALIGAGLLWLAPMVEQGLLPRMQHAVGFDARPDWRVIAFTTALSLLAVMLFGLLPALRATRSDIAPSLSTVIGRHRRSGRLPERLRGSLVVSQLAISVVLLVAGTLFVRSLLVAQAADVGFDHDRRLLASVNLQLQGYDPAKGRRFFDDVLARVRALPGVTAATWAGPIPFDGFGTGVPLWVEGMP